ncbi:carbamoyltransferase C-terminal domain-containing protein [Streptomyces jumonjinensis]|uniref:carbamoyltransferase C-terminal domain-containing protein n=1 Tax=Streptomyces jumonjinensis TaxID=1945 RepID=UPI0037BC7B93
MPAVLGLNFHHDTSVCLIADGRLYAAEEERWTGIKHNRTARAGLLTPPTHSLAWCLEASGVDIGEITEVWTPAMRPNPSLGSWTGTEREELAGMLPRPLGDRLMLLSHHTAHVLAGYLLSGEEHAAGLVIDAGGSALGSDIALGRERISGYDLRPDRIDRVHQALPTISPGRTRAQRAHPSLGHFYRNLAMRVIPPGDEVEGSMMALAAHGDPARFYGDLRRLLALGDGALVHVTPPWGSYDTATALTAGGLSWTVATASEKPLTQRADLAAAAQLVFSEAVVHVASWLQGITGARSLVFSGGCALNSQLNGVLAGQAGFERTFVAPAPHDAGTAVGAALFAWNYVLKQPRLPVPEDADWGPLPGPVPSSALNGGYVVRNVGDRIVPLVARLLAEHRIVGWVRGGLEFGPRAFGHRSILAHPGESGTRLRLNVLKRRAPFRPFAPAALVEEIPGWFESGGDPFMNRVVTVRADRADRIPAVIHRDGTARLQSVGPRHSGLRSLLEEFHRRSGLPVLLNTSLNLKGTPIVRTADQAVRAAVELSLDALAVDDTLVLAPHAASTLTDSAVGTVR